ncbi:MAG: ASCH domain-containing protein [Bacilli bacterium]|jgi:ProFAR isomerase associated superfamily protein|nr:ASCH domain-containing protein [Erysipelotrichaceae bacterium]MEE1371218.1 ASCH domain-containing protein [Bacilli bacterium]
MKHEMKLNNEPFECIKNGTKTIELRLNDEKRKLLTVGDYIEFTNRVTNEKLLVEVIDLFKYNSFEELYKHFNKIEMGYSINEEANPKDMENYYSKEEQEKYGVLGIKIKKLTK